jgi:hypothetical protein
MSTWADGYDAAAWHAVPTDTPDDLADEQVGVAWCDECGCQRTFVVLPDEEVEGDSDPDWTYWACVMCRCGPGGDVRSVVMGPPADAGWSEPQTEPYYRVTRTRR